MNIAATMELSVLTAPNSRDLWVGEVNSRYALAADSKFH